MCSECRFKLSFYIFYHLRKLSEAIAENVQVDMSCWCVMKQNTLLAKEGFYKEIVSTGDVEDHTQHLTLQPDLNRAHEW